MTDTQVARSASPKLTTAQVKVGDYLIRAKDHIGRPDGRYRVAQVVRDRGPRRFVLEGYWATYAQTAKSLSAENITQVERDGQIIGHFFVAYW